MLRFFHHMTPNWPECWFATDRILPIKCRNSKTCLKIIKIKSSSLTPHFHIKKTLLGRTRKVQNPSRLCYTVQDNHSRLEIAGAELCDRLKPSRWTRKRASVSNTKARKHRSSTLVQKWLRWAGQESQGPRPTRGPLSVMLRYFTPHYSHPRQVKQTTSATCRVPSKSSAHHCYLQLCSLFVLLAPFVSERGARAVVEFKYGMLHTQSPEERCLYNPLVRCVWQNCSSFFVCKKPSCDSAANLKNALKDLGPVSAIDIF